MATLTLTDEEFKLQQIKSDCGVSPQVYTYLLSLAKEWNVSVLTMAWLGGKPYPMQGALYKMLQNKCDKDGLIVKSITANIIQRAEKPEMRAGFECKIVLFDQRSFEDLMKKNSLEKTPIETIQHIKEMLTHDYREEGWASIETVKAPAMQNVDYINHMGATRAIDRCLRIIVRCPFTAASELADGEPGALTAAVFGDSNKVPLAAPPEKPVKAGSDVKVETKPEVAPASDGVAKPGKRKASDKVSEKQIELALVRWNDYCKAMAPGIDKKIIDDKRARLLTALYGKDRIVLLSLKEYEEFLTMLDKKEVEISVDAPEEKTEIKT